MKVCVDICDGDKDIRTTYSSKCFHLFVNSLTSSTKFAPHGRTTSSSSAANWILSYSLNISHLLELALTEVP